ncbi:hypothetical protein QR680_012767 [Steinernema hermaphroditum]|uniref:Uncharacterized protein n=1 Tax=Steinernema hermaphroditum TaxID=289476 RepID=A0AA39I5X3_9BILA|nr:hypothetical protein QR680_012767 [Steinernema hermaphroditum]
MTSESVCKRPTCLQGERVESTLHVKVDQIEVSKINGFTTGDEERWYATGCTQRRASRASIIRAEMEEMIRFSSKDRPAHRFSSETTCLTSRLRSPFHDHFFTTNKSKKALNNDNTVSIKYYGHSSLSLTAFLPVPRYLLALRHPSTKAIKLFPVTSAPFGALRSMWPPVAISEITIDDSGEARTSFPSTTFEHSRRRHTARTADTVAGPRRRRSLGRPFRRPPPRSHLLLSDARSHRLRRRLKGPQIAANKSHRKAESAADSARSLQKPVVAGPLFRRQFSTVSINSDLQLYVRVNAHAWA